ncbi:hypothetical protein BC939DRAFT_446238 [Gamsiella multidivaricata]|uniref:uncharacterized protein n=1 Tax=Gamsiella multidivaricata TaxID=101098 RepID=UPI00221E6B90|nr:uncharacterized protein BC939DRAFT_446238 [Gamsiella multidivaricata]KAI7826927.1 hypothetical protein BC939DRAFT_446238 [Gamsiella multidivaricata]
MWTNKQKPILLFLFMACMPCCLSIAWTGYLPHCAHSFFHFLFFFLVFSYPNQLYFSSSIVLLYRASASIQALLCSSFAYRSLPLDPTSTHGSTPNHTLSHIAHRTQLDLRHPPRSLFFCFRYAQKQTLSLPLQLSPHSRLVLSIYPQGIQYIETTISSYQPLITVSTYCSLLLFFHLYRVNIKEIRTKNVGRAGTVETLSSQCQQGSETPVYLHGPYPHFPYPYPSYFVVCYHRCYLTSSPLPSSPKN